MAGINNLNPVRTTKEAKARGKQGGIASGIAKRKKKLLSEIYAEVIAELYQEDIKKGTGSRFIIKEILKRKDSSSVSMWREIREGTEGSKVKHEGLPDKIEIILPEILKKPDES